MAKKPGPESQLRIPEEGSPPNNTSGAATSSRKPSTKAERQEFFLPLSGFVWLYPEEVQVVDHPAFQR